MPRYIIFKGTITITRTGADAAARLSDERNKQLIFKNVASFTGYVSEINNTHVDNAKHLDAVIPMYNITSYKKNIKK